MIYDPTFHKRHSIRLKGYDYSQEGLYFVTIAAYKKQMLFGQIINGEMILDEGGKIAEKYWLEIPKHFKNVILHDYIIMPNHIHGIIVIAVGANNNSPTINQSETTTVGANNNSPTFNPIDTKSILENQHSPTFTPNDNKKKKPLPHSPSRTLGSIVRGFKIAVVIWFRANTNIKDVWQRNYYEVIIRDARSYDNISYYIKNNPQNWLNDKLR
jgi:putative transposase